MQRPASVTTFGILNIAFALFGVFGILASIKLLFNSDAINNPIVKLMQESPAYSAWMKFSLPLGGVACVVLLVAGIGLLRLKAWARKLSIAYAIYALVFGLLGMVMNFVFLLRPMFEEALQKQGPEAAGAIGGAVGGMIGGCFSLIYPIFLLIFMTRPNVVAAFHPPETPPVLPPA